MADPFILPEGILLSMTDEGLVLEHTGDLVLQGQVPGGIHQLVSHEGNITLEADYTMHRIEAPNGTVHSTGELEADRIEAADVISEGPKFTVRVVQAGGTVSLGDAMIHAEVIVAPKVELGDDARGRITVVESHNELGATKVKGCLSLMDIEELFEGSRGFIDGWEIDPLTTGGAKKTSRPATTAKKTSRKAAPKKAEPKKAAPKKVAKEPEPEPDPEPEETLQGASLADLPDEAEATPAEVHDEPEETPTKDNGPTPLTLPPPSVGGREEQIEQLFDIFDETDGDVKREGLAEVEPEGDPAVHARISEAVNDLINCYEGSETPPVISRLSELVEKREYLTVRDEVDEIWNSLLQFHKKKKLRPKPSLTTSFNTIHAIVRDL